MNEVVVKSIAKIIARRSVQVDDILQNSYAADELGIWAEICKANSEKNCSRNRKKWYFRVKRDFENCKRATHLECQVRRTFEAFGLQTLF